MKRLSPLYILWLLMLCAGVVACTDREAMQERLAYVSACNRADTVFSARWVPTVDSLVEFFDRHGSPNDRMMAHYLQGRVHHDMGEAPRAIDCYQQAADCADTLADDCDYRTLGCIYSQMGDVFHQQLLLSDEISVRKKAVCCFEHLGRILSIASEQRFIAGTYILLNKTDSAELLLKRSIDYYMSSGSLNDAVQTTMMQMHIYANETWRITEMKHLIDQFETHCTSFDIHHELPPYMRQYYYYKGKYFENAGYLDSAEYYYRKINHPNMSPVEYNPMYKGLLSVFQKQNIADSIAKYAQLYCEVNDSSIAIKDQDLTARLAASYNYARYQQEALVHERNANFARMTLIVVIALSLFIAIIVVFSWRRYKENKENELNKQKAKYANTVDIYDHNMQALRVIYESREASFEETKEKLASMEEELRNENKQLQETITELQRQMDLKKAIDHARNYFVSPIVLHVIDLSKNPLKTLSETEKEELFSTTSEYFPTLIQHLKQADITTLGIQVCILVILKIQPGSIANLLGISIQQVTNLKSAIGQSLFDDRSARTLYKNLVQRYDVYVS